MGRQARDTVIVHRQEKLALRLLDRALMEQDEVGVDVQLDVFAQVGKWVAIKNKLGDLEETDIDRFKQRIAGETPAPKGRRSRIAAAERAEKLETIRAKLPTGSAGRTDGNSDGAVSETPSAA